MSLRFLPVGVFLYLIGGTLFGFGIGFSASTMPGLTAVVITGLGSLLITAGYFILRPFMQEAKAQLGKREQPIAENA